MRRRLLAVYALVVLVALACGPPPPPPTPVPSPTLEPLPANPVIVEVDVTSFSYKDLDIEVGTTVMWTNLGPGFHTITHTPTEIGQELEWVSSGNMPKGRQFRHTFNKVGRFRYVCNIHAAAERGFITVVEP